MQFVWTHQIFGFLCDIAIVIGRNQLRTYGCGNYIAKNARNLGIKLFSVFIKEVYGNLKTNYIYNGNGSFVMLTENADYITVEDIMHLFRLRLDERDEYTEIVLEYKIGIAETFKENKTARKLLSEAIKNKKAYTSDIRTK